MLARWQSDTGSSARSMHFQTEHYQAHKICIVSTVNNLSPTFPPSSPQRVDPTSSRESGGHLLCIHYTPPPASTNQEPEQGGRLGKHIVTTADLYVWLSAGGDRDAETAGQSGQQRRSSGGFIWMVITISGHPWVYFGMAPEQGPHAHILTNTNTSKQDTYSSLGGCKCSLLLSIKVNHSKSVSIHIQIRITYGRLHW